MKKCLIQAANGAIKVKNSFYQAKANKLTLQLGSRNKAKVAIANKIAKIIFMMMNDASLLYKDPGLPKAKTPEKQIKNLLSKLKNLGVNVEYYTKEKIVAKSEFQVSI